MRYTIKATAIGAGRAKSNVEAQRDVFPMVNPNPDGGLTAMTVLYNDLHPTVGLLSVACTSNAISVGGIFNVDVHSPNPPEDLIVYLVRVVLETQVELRTKRKGKQMVPTQRHKLWERGWVPPRPSDPHGPGDGNKAHGFIRNCGNGDAWTVQTIARIPDDNVIRSSTMPGSRSDIRFSHTLVVEVIHSRDPQIDGSGEKERKLKVFALRQPVILPSCCVTLQAVTLPKYSEEDDIQRPANMPYDIGLQHIGQPGAPRTLPPEAPWANTALPQHGSRHDYCVCGMTLADLTARESSMIPQRAGYDVPIDQVRNHGKIGEMPVEDDVGEALRRTASRSASSSRSVRSGSVSRANGGLARSVSRHSQCSNVTVHNEGITITGASSGRGPLPGADPSSLGAPPSYHSLESTSEEEPRGRATMR